MGTMMNILIAIPSALICGWLYIRVADKVAEW